MYIFILAIFLQSSPYPVVAFYNTYETKAACMYHAEEMKEKLPEDKHENVVCIQVVRASAVKEI